MFRNTFGNALKKRLAPNTALHPKQLADYLGCDVQTVYNHMNSRNSPEGDFICAYLAFFVKAGDHGFLTEIFPGVTPLLQRNKRAEKIAALFDEVLKEGATA